MFIPCRPQSMTVLKTSGNIFMLTLTGGGGDAHFLTPALLESFRSELDYVKKKFRNGSVLITTAEGKNFCNGFDCSCAACAGAGRSDVDGKDVKKTDLFKEVVKDLISLPMPTIAAINGHTKSAGLILAMSHDYLTMKTGMDELCMSQLEHKRALPDYFTAMIRSKVPPHAWARFALRGLIFTSEDAKEMGLAVEPPRRSGQHYLDTAIQLAEELSGHDWDGKVYAEIRKALYPDLCDVLGLNCAP